MQLDQYTYVFAIGTGFSFLDAWNNGASTLAVNPLFQSCTNLFLLV